MLTHLNLRVNGKTFLLVTSLVLLNSPNSHAFDFKLKTLFSSSEKRVQELQDQDIVKNNRAILSQAQQLYQVEADSVNGIIDKKKAVDNFIDKKKAVDDRVGTISGYGKKAKYWIAGAWNQAGLESRLAILRKLKQSYNPTRGDTVEVIPQRMFKEFSELHFMKALAAQKPGLAGKTMRDIVVNAERALTLYRSCEFYQTRSQENKNSVCEPLKEVFHQYAKTTDYLQIIESGSKNLNNVSIVAGKSIIGARLVESQDAALLAFKEFHLRSQKNPQFLEVLKAVSPSGEISAAGVFYENLYSDIHESIVSRLAVLPNSGDVKLFKKVDRFLAESNAMKALLKCKFPVIGFKKFVALNLKKPELNKGRAGQNTNVPGFYGAEQFRSRLTRMTEVGKKDDLEGDLKNILDLSRQQVEKANVDLKKTEGNRVLLTSVLDAIEAPLKTESRQASLSASKTASCSSSSLSGASPCSSTLTHSLESIDSRLSQSSK